jgi:4,5-DOPA dioxygenase extradiol
MYPRGDVPLLQMSLPRRSGEELYALGRLLAPLAAEGVLIVTTGNLTHNLRRADSGPSPTTPSWAIEFDLWCRDVLVRSDIDALLSYRVRAPGFAMAHPTEEHFLPLLVAVGAASVGPFRVSFPVQGFEMGTVSRRCVQMDRVG